MINCFKFFRKPLSIKSIASMLINVAILIRGFTIIGGCFWISQKLQNYFDLIIPASVLGLLLLFTLMVIGLIRIEWVRPSSQLILKWLIFLFIPITTGILKYWPMISSSIIPIVASVLLSSLIVLLCVAFTISIIAKGDES